MVFNRSSKKEKKEKNKEKIDKKVDKKPISDEPLKLPILKGWHWRKNSVDSSLDSPNSELLWDSQSPTPSTSSTGNAVSHGECFACKLPLYDLPEIYAMRRRWHEECFHCSQCGKNLSPLKFYEKNGEVYCEEDYNQLFLVKCFKCSGSIHENPISVQGKDYHPLCFTCTKCQDPICHINFHERKGIPYCEECYHFLFSLKCTACGDAIRDSNDMIVALGGTYHKEHFVCYECAEPLTRTNFIKEEGYVYCEKDYHKLYSPPCAGCNEPIYPEGLVAFGKKWHKDCCPRCVECNAILMEDNCVQVKNKNYCRVDWKKLFAPKCHTCSRPIGQALTGESVIQLGRDYHPGCFICRDCHLRLDERSFYEVKGEPYCYQHYHNRTCTDCHKAKGKMEMQHKKILAHKTSSVKSRSMSPINLFLRPKSR